MNFPRLLLTTGLAGFLASWLAACAPKQEGPRIVLGFSQIGSESAWRLANTESIRSAAATSNIELKFSDANQKQENQIAALRRFIAEKVDVIAFAPVVSTGWEPVLQEAKAAGIPVILTDRAVDADASLYAGFLGSDFVEEGRKAGRWVVSQFRDPAQPVNIVQLEGTPGSAPANDRKKGFEEIIGQHPNFRIIRSVSGDFARASGEAATVDILASDKNRFQVLYAHNDDMALGAIKALEEAGLRPGKDVLIVSIDAVHAAFEAMIAGKLNATVECNPLMGPQLMTSVTEVVSGRPIPRRLVVDEAVFTAGNARQYIQTRKY
jgi:galactofuranose transport system substrate-binding protein